MSCTGSGESHIDGPEVKKEAGGNEEERDDTHQGTKRGDKPILRERKVVEDIRTPVLEACRVCPCIAEGAIVVTPREFVDASRSEPVELSEDK